MSRTQQLCGKPRWLLEQIVNMGAEAEQHKYTATPAIALLHEPQMLTKAQRTARVKNGVMQQVLVVAKVKSTECETTQH